MRKIHITLIVMALLASNLWAQGLTVKRYPFYSRTINYEKGEILSEEPLLPEVAMGGEKWAKLGIVDASQYEPGPLVETKDKLFWCAKFTGALVAPENGEYLIQIRADDYANLILGGDILIQQYGKRAGLTTESDPVKLEKGKAYPILIEYWNVLGPSVLEVKWKTPGSSEFVKIPKSAFKPEIPLSPYAVTEVRFFPAPGKAELMKGGHFSGSYTSPTNDFEPFATIEDIPAEGQWNEIEVKNPKPYRYVKYEAPKGSHGAIAELEFYHGNEKFKGEAFGTAGSRGDSGNTYPKALDRDTDTFYEGMDADNQYVGIDLGAESQVPQPSVALLDTESDAQTFVKIDIPENSFVRYTISPERTYQQQTEPGLLEGEIYTKPFSIARDLTVMAKAFDMRRAESQRSIEPFTLDREPLKPGKKTYHSGNSLMGGLSEFIPMIAASTGFDHNMQAVGFAGAPTDLIWKQDQANKEFRKEMAEQKPDIYIPQPFGGRTVATETFYLSKIYDVALEANPDCKLYMYMQWPKDDIEGEWWKRSWPTYRENEKGKFQNDDGSEYWIDPSQFELKEGEKFMQEDWRAHAVYRESADEWDEVVDVYARHYDFLYQQMTKLYPDKDIAVIPVGLVLKEIFKAIEAGDMPGVDPETGNMFFFADGLHLNPKGQYVSALTHFACIYEMNPTGKVSSAGSGLTPEQADTIHKICWKVVTEYRHSPLQK